MIVGESVLSRDPSQEHNQNQAEKVWFHGKINRKIIRSVKRRYTNTVYDPGHGLLFFGHVPWVFSGGRGGGEVVVVEGRGSFLILSNLRPVLCFATFAVISSAVSRLFRCKQVQEQDECDTRLRQRPWLRLGY